ncbi:glycosyltransferase [Planctomycetota bacterium]
MRILMIAPEPCFIPRGTPMSVLARCRALTELGHTIDLLTYPVGDDVSLDGLSIIRTPRLFGIRRVKAGPSVLKMLLDVFVFFKTWRLLRRGDYDCVHTHEEASFIGALFARRYGIPHLYDMHSSLSEQLANYRWFPMKPMVWFAKKIEQWMLKRTDFVICICQKLADGAGGLAETAVIHNVPLPEDTIPPVPATEAVALYVGNFGNNQGLDLLIDSISLVRKHRSDVRFVLAGGERRRISKLYSRIAKLEIEHSVQLMERTSTADAARLLADAAVLLSPRPRGENVPLKIYHYLHAGKPIVATDIPAHTQVLNDTTAVLTDVSPPAFAEGILRVLSDAELARKLGAAAGDLAEREYSYPAYREKVNEAYRRCTRSS